MNVFSQQRAATPSKLPSQVRLFRDKSALIKAFCVTSPLISSTFPWMFTTHYSENVPFQECNTYILLLKCNVGQTTFNYLCNYFSKRLQACETDYPIPIIITLPTMCIIGTHSSQSEALYDFTRYYSKPSFGGPNRGIFSNHYVQSNIAIFVMTTCYVYSN